ncbi:MAG TPA: hypothetical protein IAD28_06430 [Candidatus Faeciplasma avium]|uniref:Sporulation protein YunB n=1 Tax=Candidatus Faeciplasma avium TaxID=2840798 RepID=A0A9D1T5C8_9FIRM|nr:hypothetical protein [Candidatus Faeciplasma avium]
MRRKGLTGGFFGRSRFLIGASRDRLPVIFLLSLLLAAVILLNRTLGPVVMSMARQYGSLAVSRTVSEAVSSVFELEALEYSELVSLSYSESGMVTSAQYNTSRINRLRTTVSEELIKALEGLRASKIKLPLGSITGELLSSGKGPGIRLRIAQASYPKIELFSSFESAGINIVKNEIILRITIDSVLYLPPAKESFSLTQDFVIAQTIIVGSIPEGYTSIAL